MQLSACCNGISKPHSSSDRGYGCSNYIQAFRTEHANTRFWQCLGQCTSRTGDRMVSLRFVGSGGAYMQKPV